MKYYIYSFRFNVRSAFILCIDYRVYSIGVCFQTAVPFSYPLQHFPTLKQYWKEEATADSSPHKPTNTIDARLHSLIQDR